MTRRIRSMITIVIAITLMLVPMPVMAKGKTKLSVKSKTIYEGESFRIHLNGKNGKVKAKNIKWKISDTDVAVIAKKEKKQIRIEGKGEGTTTLTARYKGKIYSCKIRVYERKDDDSDEEDDSDTGSDWLSELDKQYEENMKKVDQKIEDFKSRYLTDGMSEYQKMDAVAKYISSEYDYESYQEDWIKMMLTENGDCYASRIAVMNICRKIGLKAVACPKYEDHGRTIVKADGKLYLVTTGYKGAKPRDYDIEELTKEWFNELTERNHIDPAYFEK